MNFWDILKNSFPIFMQREIIITLGMWPSRHGAYISCWAMNQVKYSSNSVDDECCAESKTRSSVENAQYDHNEIWKWYSLLTQNLKTRYITFLGWTIQWSNILSHIQDWLNDAFYNEQLNKTITSSTLLFFRKKLKRF